MMFILRELISRYTATIAEKYDIIRTEELSSDNKEIYNQSLLDADRNIAVKNEIKLLIAEADKNIRRSSRANEDLAIHRGGLMYLEAYIKKIERKARAVRVANKKSKK